MKVFSMFTGYGGCCWGLKKANIDYELVGYSEIDKYAIKCFEENFPEHKGKNLGSCKEINPNDIPNFDLLTAGFPCQDVSIAGKRDLTKGRSMLINDVFRIIEIKKPKYVILENVKGLLSMVDFWNSIRWTLQKLGYGVLYSVLNSKDYGIPQNRERIWIICKYGGWDFMEFQFPYKERLEIFVRDILEDEVDKKYYLSEKQIKAIEKSNFRERKPLGLDTNVISALKVGGDVKAITLNTKGEQIPNLAEIGEANRIYSDGGITPTIKGNVNIKISSANKRGYEIANEGDTIRLSHIGSETGRGRVGHQQSQALVSGGDMYYFNGKNIRRLTPRECFRLMGFLNDEIKFSDLSNTQLYKLAGNGWDVNLVSKIMRNLFK